MDRTGPEIEFQIDVKNEAQMLAANLANEDSNVGILMAGLPTSP